MQIKIGNKKVGDGQPVFIVAELGINHNGGMKLAKEMMFEAKRCGADAVKLQSFVTEDFVGDKNLMYTYKSQGREVTESQFKMFKRYELNKKTQRDLFDYAKKIKLILFSTPQDSSFEMVDYLCGKEINMPAIKVGSDDLTNLPLLAYYAGKGKPIIISTGMATIDEIQDAVTVIGKQGCQDLIILKCTSLYPTPPEEANLNQLTALREVFAGVIGYSDHTMGTTAAVVAAVLGAKMIEKHFTLDKNSAGPDHWLSADPAEFALMVKQVREAEKLPGKPQFILSKAELAMKRDCRRSIMAIKPIKRGDKIKADQLDVKRPGTGLPPKYLPTITGRVAKKDLAVGYIFTEQDL